MNIRSGQNNLVIVNVHFEPDLPLRQLRVRLRLIHPHWPAYACGVGVFWVISTSVIRKKDGLMFGTNHSLRATRERLQCSILSFPVSLRLPNLITQEETLQPLGSYALCRGLIVFLSIYPWLKHVTSIALLMSLRTSNYSERPRCSTPRHPETYKSRTPEQTYSQLDVQASHFFCSSLQQLHDDHRFSPDPFCALAEFKDLLHKAKKMTKRELSRQTPDCTGAQLFITSTASRAHRNRHLWTLMRCCEAWKPVEDCSDTSLSVSIFQRHSQIFAGLTRENLEAREAEVSTLP